MGETVAVVEAPGYRNVKAVLIPGMHEVPVSDHRVTVSAIVFDNGDFAIVPSRCVIRGVDLVKRYDVDYDYDRGEWGVRLAFGGPFVYHEENGVSAWEWKAARSR